MMNPITLIDGYKLDHRRQYPDKTTRVYSNWTPRESRVPGIDRVVFFGLQYFLNRYLDAKEGEFSRFFGDDIDVVAAKYAARVNGYLGPNSIGVDHIRALHALGHIPLRFSALPEGTRVPLRVPMLVVENTHPDFAWLVNYFETLMSNVLWLPCTSATTADRIRRMLDFAAKITGTDPGFVGWQGHDFSFRGMPGPEAAALSGAGHLLSFTGTDTIPALDLVEQHYGPLPIGYLLGASVAATEHSVMCAGGKENEAQTFARLLRLYPAGIVSIVSDTWDIWKVLTETMPALRGQIMGRDGKIVIRPDSGNPADIVCGDPVKGGPAGKGVIELLWDIFGGTETTTGHRMLDSHIGCIYGDSISYERAREIVERLRAKGFASGNMVFGVGSYTYQHVTRDTFGFAMKSTWVEVDGEGRDIWKQPITDSGTKNSAVGRLAVLRNGDALILVTCATPEQEGASELRLVWADGQFIARDTFDAIRERLRSQD
jgi:nicotinamide phosphoribosyltransferase